MDTTQTTPATPIYRGGLSGVVAFWISSQKNQTDTFNRAQRPREPVCLSLWYWTILREGTQHCNLRPNPLVSPLFIGPSVTRSWDLNPLFAWRRMGHHVAADVCFRPLQAADLVLARSTNPDRGSPPPLGSGQLDGRDGPGRLRRRSFFLR